MNGERVASRSCCYWISVAAGEKCDLLKTLARHALSRILADTCKGMASKVFVLPRLIRFEGIIQFLDSE